jgi:hypothetical protein
MQRRTGKSRAAITKAVREAVYSFCCE